MYKLQADRFGIRWQGRRYDRANPTAADLPNQALNHAASAVEAAAAIAVAATATIPQLGFIHEDSGQSFVLDIADLFRDDVTVPIAFGGVVDVNKSADLNIERVTRKRAGATLRKSEVIERMIDRIKQLFGDPEPTAGIDPRWEWLRGAARWLPRIGGVRPLFQQSRTVMPVAPPHRRG